MVMPHHSFSHLLLPCFVQCVPNEPDTPISLKEFDITKLARFKGNLQADYEVFQKQGPVMDANVLPGYLFFFEEMNDDGMSVIVFPAGSPAEAESMVLSCCVVLKENYDHRELTEFAQLHPERGFKRPPEPPYCSITPQDLYAAHKERMGEIMNMVRGYAFMWLAFSKGHK